MVSKKQNGRMSLGILFITVGVISIIHKLNILPPLLDSALFSWQMLLIAFGIFSATNKSYTIATIFIATGTLFLLPELFYIDLIYRELFWPFALVIVGVIFVFRNKKGLNSLNSNKDFNYIDHASMFGNNKLNFSSNNFKAGRITSLFGGNDIILTQCNMQENIVEIDFLTIFAGSKIYVPNNWKVQVDVVSIFGGFKDKRNTANVNNEKTLVIKGFTLFGGGEIKN